MNCKFLQEDICVITSNSAPLYCSSTRGDCRKECQLHSSRELSNYQWLKQLDIESFADVILKINGGCKDNNNCSECELVDICGNGYRKDRLIDWLETPKGFDLL